MDNENKDWDVFDQIAFSLQNLKQEKIYIVMYQNDYKDKPKVIMAFKDSHKAEEFATGLKMNVKESIAINTWVEEIYYKE